MSQIQFNKLDVSLEEIEPELCTECEERPATHYIQVDVRALGCTTVLGPDRYCFECGKEDLELLQASLPAPFNEEGTFPAEVTT